MTQEITTPRPAAPGAAFEPARRRTGALLVGGVVAGPLYLAVSLAQALTRDGFDLTRHALSLLENGPLGRLPAGHPGRPGGGQLARHPPPGQFGIGLLCLIAACFAVARGLAALGRRRPARTSQLAGAVILASVLASFATTGTTGAVAAVWVAVVAAWAWLAVTAAGLYSKTTHTIGT